MIREEWQRVAAVLDEATGPGGVAPAASLLVGRGGLVVFEHCAGTVQAPASPGPCRESTVFDLASLTKPLVTVTLVLDLVARSRLFLDTRVVDILPAFADPADPRRAFVTIRHLLRHDSGLPAYQRYFERFDAVRPDTEAAAASRRRRMLDLALAEPLERDPRSGSVYSDIGFLVLGAVVEEVGGARLDELALERVLGPLGVADARYLDLAVPAPPAFAARCAPCGPCEWRGRGTADAVHAEVQDENAWAMGGVAGHAGLFGTARSVHRVVAEWVDAWAGHGLLLDRRLVRHAWDRDGASLGAAPSTWALGWDTPTPGASSAGGRIGAPAVGHLGYTGTSVWIDLRRRAHVVLLTNRIACGRNSDAIRALRPRVHDAVFAALDRARH